MTPDSPTPPLDPSDVDEAKQHMLRWAEGTHRLNRSAIEFSAAASTDLNGVLKHIVNDRARRAFGWDAELRKPKRSMVRTMAPYLRALTTAAQPILNWALEYRLVAARLGHEWPAGTELPDLRDPAFLQRLELASGR